MEEKVLKKSKNGLAMVTLFILLYAAAIAAIIVGSIMVEQAETKAGWIVLIVAGGVYACLLYTSPSPRDGLLSRMPSSA